LASIHALGKMKPTPPKHQPVKKKKERKIEKQEKTIGAATDTRQTSSQKHWLRKSAAVAGEPLKPSKGRGYH